MKFTFVFGSKEWLDKVDLEINLEELVCSYYF